MLQGFETFVLDPSSEPVLLPPDIRAMIKRKSSRDPISRFAYKLHLLLMYAGDDVGRQNYIGAGWTCENQFRINKKRLITVMEIKLNTLNVNLKDLGFQQLQCDHNGWTEWSRHGFNRTSTLADLADVSSDKISGKDGDKTQKGHFVDESMVSKVSSLRDIVFGRCELETLQVFKRIANSIWEEIIDGIENKNSISFEEFLPLVSERFRVSHQSLKNAKRVLEVMFLCDPKQVTIQDFARFLAKFGPEETVMEKIGSLTSSSNQNDHWFRPVYGVPTDIADCSTYGYFDETEQNCIVIVQKNVKQCKVYNRLDIAIPGEYLIDDQGTTYSSWQDFFEKNPHPQVMYNW